MLKNNTILEVKTGEKTYQFNCDSDSPLGEIHDALMKMKLFVADRIMQVHKEQQPQESKDEQQSSS